MGSAGVVYQLEISSSQEQLAQRAADLLASQLKLALAERDRVLLALAGGTTPAAAYRQLGQAQLAWNRVDVLLGDERWVGPQDPSSNARMLHETLLAQGPARPLYDLLGSVWSLSASHRSKYSFDFPIIKVRRALILNTGANLNSSP